MTREQVLRHAVGAAAVPVGAAVQVYTRMGRLLAEGSVTLPTAAGLCLGAQFFSENLHLFVPVAVEEEAHTCADSDADVMADDLVLEVDQRIARKLGEATRKVGRGKGKLSPDALPQDVRKAIITTTDMSDEEINQVLAAVGDATLKALKGVGVREDEIYTRVAKVQAAVRRALQPTAEDAQAAKQDDDD